MDHISSVTFFSRGPRQSQPKTKAETNCFRKKFQMGSFRPRVNGWEWSNYVKGKKGSTQAEGQDWLAKTEGQDQLTRAEGWDRTTHIEDRDKPILEMSWPRSLIEIGRFEPKLGRVNSNGNLVEIWLNSTKLTKTKL